MCIRDRLVTVSRDGQPSSFELTASPYVLVSVEERVIGDSVGYIRIRGFHNNTTCLLYTSRCV